MKTLLLSMCVVLTGCASVVKVDSWPSDEANAIKPQTQTQLVCLLENTPEQLTMRQIGEIYVEKRTYGEVGEVLPSFVARAKKMGANAVVDFYAKQRFRGFMPHKMVAPTAYGMAVVVEESFNCESFGGTSE